jgi:hypothetical protein
MFTQRLKLDRTEASKPKLSLITIEVRMMNNLAGILFAVLSAAPAAAHDATPTPAQPKGWSYPFSCCTVAGKATGRTICLFVSPRSF